MLRNKLRCHHILTDLKHFNGFVLSSASTFRAVREIIILYCGQDING